ncbi:hypothetical protein DEJ50_03240 [Streptomyces venezuelae]|uniref:Uncharacterized protein n=1 Tax=Streptomyces venezuelae TaxID=54571 RepID=A0A5P2CX63_STRVZ|nr:hypothetical protein [Streptomyces venezuelae]QES47013.1 hypothetical protein DEJ50_03240 [Streptomyces venezuelae]
MGPALLTAAIIIAVWIIRTAVRELRRPGSASAEWAFLRDPRALGTGAAAACPLGVLGWLQAGAEGLVWALLAAALVTYAVSKLRSE